MALGLPHPESELGLQLGSERNAHVLDHSSSRRSQLLGFSKLMASWPYEYLIKSPCWMMKKSCNSAVLMVLDPFWWGYCNGYTWTLPTNNPRCTPKSRQRQVTLVSKVTVQSRVKYDATYRKEPTFHKVSTTKGYQEAEADFTVFIHYRLYEWNEMKQTHEHADCIAANKRRKAPLHKSPHVFNLKQRKSIALQSASTSEC